MTSPVTLYVVTHNYTRFLREALESVDAQTCRPKQLIIIDNGSTDGVEEVLKDYVGREDITIIHNPNIGHVKAANQALKLATEKYFMRLDGDDILMPWALEYLVKSMEANTEAAYAFGDYVTIDEKGNLLDYCSGITHKPIKGVQNAELLTPQLDLKTYFSDQLHKEFAPHGAVTMIRKGCLLKVGGYDDKIRSNDGGYLCEKLASFQLIHLSQDAFFYRKHNHSLTQSLKQK